MNLIRFIPKNFKDQEQGIVVNDLLDYYNEKLLDDIYFTPKKINKSLVTSKLQDCEFQNKLEKLNEFISHNNIEQIIIEMVQQFENQMNYRIDNETIYIILGLATTTIYSTKKDGKEVTVLCLESIDGDMDYLRMLLAHEFSHFVRKGKLKKNIFEECIGERLITEGIAINYSQEIVPNKEETMYCIVPKETFLWVKGNGATISELVGNDLDNNRWMTTLFSMGAKIPIKDMPIRCGYVYGYLKVKEYLKENHLKIKDIIDIDWRVILC